MATLPKPPGIPSSNFQIAIGTNDSPITYAAIANLGDFSGPSTAANVVDVAKHGDKFRRFVTTLINSGVVTSPCWFDPSVPTLAGNPLAITEQLKSRELRPYIIVETDDDGIFISAVMKFNAYVSKFSQKLPVAGVWSADIEFQIDGEVTYLWPNTTEPTGQAIPV